MAGAGADDLKPPKAWLLPASPTCRVSSAQTLTRHCTSIINKGGHQIAAQKRQDDTTRVANIQTADLFPTMSKKSDLPNVGKLALDDEDVEDLFASPESGATTQKHTPSSQASSSAHKNRSDSRSRQNEQEARDARLRAELEKIREVNRVIENVTSSLTKAKENMETVNRTVNNASTLLATWTRILSQTEHNQRLILNPNWYGATQDLEDAENEDLRRQQEAERRALEEQRRREEVQRRAEEEERRKAIAAATPTRGSGKVRGVRGTRASTRGYGGVGGQSGAGRGASARATTSGSRGASGSGIARSASTRGRGRGLS